MSHLLDRRCAAVYCRRAGSDGKLRMFSFPRGSSDVQHQRYDIWADVAENPDLKIRRPRAYLCAHHFLPEQFTDRSRYKLLRGAVPSRDAWHFSLASANTSPPIVHPATSTSQPSEPIHSTTSTTTPESSTHTLLLPSTSISQPRVSVTSTSTLQPSESIYSATSTSTLESNTHSHLLPSTSTSHPELPVLPTSSEHHHFLPSTSTPKSFQPVQLFPPILDANNTSESNFDTLATPLDGTVSQHESVLADDIADITPASTCKAGRKCRSSILSKIKASRISQLTPRKKFLYGKLKSKESALMKLRKKYKNKTLALKELTVGYKSKTHYIVSRLSKSMSLSDSTCNNCRACITTDVVENFHSNISLKEHFANKCLSYPTEELCKAVGAGALLLEKLMPEVAYLPGVWKRVASAIEETVDFSWSGEKCVDHKVPIVNGTVHGNCAISIPWWCRRLNRSLSCMVVFVVCIIKFSFTLGKH